MRVRVHPRAGGLPADLGSPELPASKSHAQRAMLLAAFTAATWRLDDLEPGDDVRALSSMLAAVGAQQRWDGDTLWIRGSGPLRGRTVRIDAGENGTAARALLLLVPLLGGYLDVDGSPALRRRPMAAAAAALRSLGIPCARDELPMTADGRRFHVAPGNLVEVDAATTTQPATGALLAMGLLGGGRVRALQPRAVGYLDLTAQVLRAFGAGVERSVSPSAVDYVVGPVPAQDGRMHVPRDPSARAVPLVLAAMHGAPVPAALRAAAGDSHPDWGVDGDVERLARAPEADVVLDGAGARPDVVPALAVLAASRPGTTTFRGVGALRTKESDRLAALASALVAAGVACAAEADSLRVRGPLPASGSCRVLPAVPDHRIVMALALLGTRLPGGVELDHAESVAKSWPGFFDWLGRCAEVRLEGA